MSFKYYDTFISSKDKAIPCCNNLHCNLCLGKYYVQVQQDDINLIDRLIQDKLQSRLQEIKDNLRINTIDQFLDYHQRKYSYQLSFLYNYEKAGNPGHVINFSFKYKNNGTIDWSSQTYFKCIDPIGFKDMKSPVTSLISGAEDDSAIQFKLPQIEEGKYITKWRLCCKRNQEEIIFGPTIEIECEVEWPIVDYNCWLLKNLKELDPSVTSDLDFDKAPKILQENKNNKFNMDWLFNLLLKDN